MSNHRTILSRIQLRSIAKELFIIIPQQAFSAWLILLKLTIPALIIVRIMMCLQLTPYLSIPFEPVMTLMGLPKELALVWVTGMLTNIYTGIVILLNISPTIGPLTVIQATILGSIILISHSLPVESSVCGGAGVSPFRITILRIGSAIVYGIILFKIASLTAIGQEQASIVIQLSQDPLPDWSTWAIDSLKSIIAMLVIITILLIIMATFRKIGIIRLISLILSPLLKLAGIGPKAIMVTVIGNIMGLGYGGGLIIAESRSGQIPKPDIYGSIVLMALCHSLLEDTILMTALGGSIWGLFVGRLIFALLLTAAITRVARRPGFQKFLVGRKYFS